MQDIKGGSFTCLLFLVTTMLFLDLQDKRSNVFVIRHLSWFFLLRFGVSTLYSCLIIVFLFSLFMFFQTWPRLTIHKGEALGLLTIIQWMMSELDLN